MPIGRCCANSRDELAFPARVEALDQLHSQRPRALAQRRDGLGRQRRREQRAVLRLLGRIERDRRQRGRGVAVPRHDEQARREALVVLEDLVDVLAARRDPVAAVARRPEDVRHAGRLQPLQRTVIVAVDHLDVVEVEVVHQRSGHVRRHGRLLGNLRMAHRGVLEITAVPPGGKHFVQVAEETRRVGAVDHPVVVAQRQRRHQPPFERASAPRLRLPLRAWQTPRIATSGALTIGVKPCRRCRPAS